MPGITVTMVGTREDDMEFDCSLLVVPGADHQHGICPAAMANRIRSAVEHRTRSTGRLDEAVAALGWHRSRATISAA